MFQHHNIKGTKVVFLDLVSPEELLKPKNRLKHYNISMSIKNNLGELLGMPQNNVKGTKKDGLSKFWSQN